MALIKCTECGQTVSDKASACPHCGHPVEKSVVCPECGQAIEPGQSICPNCGFPIQRDTEATQLERELGQKSPQPYYEFEEEKPKRTGLWIVLALLALAAVGGTVWWILSQDQQNAQEEVVEETAIVEEAPTVEGVTVDLMKFVDAGDEVGTINFLDGIQTKATECLNRGDQNAYFNLIYIVKTVWENNKDAILAKLPSLADKMHNYTSVPENLSAAFTEYVNQNTESVVYAETTVENDDFSNNSPQQWAGASSIEELKQKLDGTFWHGSDRGILRQFHFSNGKIYYKTAIRGSWGEEYVFNTYDISFHRTNTKNFLAVKFGYEEDQKIEHSSFQLAFLNKCQDVFLFQFGEPLCEMEFGEYVFNDDL